MLLEEEPPSSSSFGFPLSYSRNGFRCSSTSFSRHRLLLHQPLLPLLVVSRSMLLEEEPPSSSSFGFPLSYSRNGWLFCILCFFLEEKNATIATPLTIVVLPRRFKIGSFKIDIEQNNVIYLNQEIKESVQSDSMHHVSLLVQPMLQPLDAAFAHYDVDQHKRSAKATGKPPNGLHTVVYACGYPNTNSGSVYWRP
ncbi:hypothetical protein L2E82_10371 [Cichorium intybus]|uniref:Uncharacterized protein n=1 Tax=Cichorium intybus TaxID=13427 RepID=A0ACB9GAF6_CICIN|nr:hypothetical protein L2E82_10371 [Cichorium intybus]